MKRLRYVSRFSRIMSRAEVDELAEHARRKNAQLGLTGILMTSGRLFFQVLEGPAPAVEEVFSLIIEDPRHTDVHVLESEQSVTERLFPDWSMRQVSLDDSSDARLAPARKILQRVGELRFELDQLTYKLERTIWEELTRKK